MQLSPTRVSDGGELAAEVARLRILLHPWLLGRGRSLYGRCRSVAN